MAVIDYARPEYVDAYGDGWPFADVRDYHGEHDQQSHGNWAEGKRLDGQVPLSNSSTDVQYVEGVRQRNLSTVANHVGGIPSGTGVKHVLQRGPTLEVGGLTFEVGGQYDPLTNEVTIYSGSFREDHTVDVGIVAHELQHAKFQQWRNVATREYYQIQSMPASERDKYYNVDLPDRLTPAGKEKFKHYAVWAEYRSDALSDALEEHDGITDYSKSYWTAYKTDPNASFDTAANETLAELARLKADGAGLDKVHSVWRKLYDDITKLTY